MKTHQIIWLVITSVGTLSLVVKLWDLRKDSGNRPLRWLCAGIGAMVLSYAGQYDGVRRWVDAHTAPGVDWVVSNCFSLIACMATHAVFLHVVSPDDAARRVRVRAWATFGVVALVLLLFATTESNYVEFTTKLSTPQEVPPVGPHLYVFTAWLAVTATGVFVSGRQYALIAPRFSLRAGLRLLAFGMALVVVYCVVRVGMAVGYQLGLLPPGSPFDLGPGVIFRTAVPAILIGAVLPAWGPVLGLDRAAEWIGVLRARRRLTPLWHALLEAFPEVVLDQPGKRNVRVALHRGVIEIWDARLRLRPWFDPAAVVSDDPAVAEAELLDAALRARASGVPGAEGVAVPSNQPDDEPDERWLGRVSDAFAVIRRKRPPAVTAGGLVRTTGD